MVIIELQRNLSKYSLLWAGHEIWYMMGLALSKLDISESVAHSVLTESVHP